MIGLTGKADEHFRYAASGHIFEGHIELPPAA